MANDTKQTKRDRWKRFGDYLKDRRVALQEAAGTTSDIWTQGYVADRAGLSRQTYNNIENGKPTKPATIETIAQVLEIDPQEAMFRAGFAPDPKAQQSLSPLEIRVLTDFKDLPEEIRKYTAAAISAVASQVRAKRAADKLEHAHDPDHSYNHADPPLVTGSDKNEVRHQNIKGVPVTK